MKRPSERQKQFFLNLVPSSECIQIIELGPADPFLLAKVPLASVLHASSGANGRLMQMIRTEGVVTYKGAQMLCLQEKESGMRVFLEHEIADIKYGDHVEVAGLPLADGFSPKLVQAIVRKTGKDVLPEAQLIDFMQAVNQSTQDTTRAQEDALFERYNQSDSALRLELRSQATKRNFYAYLPPNVTLPSSVLPGTLVRLCGVIKLLAEEPLDANQVVTTFEMYLNLPADIQVLQEAPWWTARHTFWALGGLSAVRIFSHGFTTRPGGHGLHSGALAAHEMGGTLKAHSDGPGTGARFVLDLPIQSPSSNEQK